MRILIIDDNRNCARSLQKLISLLPVEVDVSNDQLCMVQMQDKKYDLIICDIMMPSISGDEIYYNAPKHLKDKFVFYTGGVLKEKEIFCEHMRKRGRLFQKDNSADIVLHVQKKLQSQRKMKIPQSFNTLATR